MHRSAPSSHFRILTAVSYSKTPLSLYSVFVMGFHRQKGEQTQKGRKKKKIHERQRMHADHGEQNAHQDK